MSVSAHVSKTDQDQKPGGNYLMRNPKQLFSRSVNTFLLKCFACVALFSSAAFGQFVDDSRKSTVKTEKAPVSIVMEEGSTTTRILLATRAGSKTKTFNETPIAERQIEISPELLSENNGEITFSIINGGGTFGKSGMPILTVSLGKDSIYIPEILAGKAGEEGILRVLVNGNPIVEDIRIAAVSKEDIVEARNFFPLGMRSTIAQSENFLIVDESKIENLPSDTVNKSYNEDGTATEQAGLCIRVAWGPGKVNYSGFSPWAVGKRYSYKPESSYNLVRGSGTSDNVDAVYRYSWGCGTAMKIPDSCTVTFYNDGSYSICCNAAMMALGHKVAWVNPTSHGFPRCPLAP